MIRRFFHLSISLLTGLLLMFSSCVPRDRKVNDETVRTSLASDTIQILLQNYQRQINTSPDSAYHSAEKALQLSQGSDEKTMVDIFFALGVAFDKLGQYDLAMFYFKDKALEYSKRVTLTPSLLATLYNHTGQTALRLEQGDKAMEFFPKALEIRKAQDDLEGQASSYRNIGTAYQSERKFKEAEEHYLKSLQLYTQLKNIEGQASCYLNLGNLHFEMIEYERALEFYRKSEQYCIEINHTELLLTVIYNMGLLIEDLGEYEQASREYLKVLRIATMQHNSQVLAEAYYSLGRSMNNSGKADSAIYYLNKAIETANQSNLEELKSWALADRAGIYAAIGRYKEATDDYDSALIAKDKVDKKNLEKVRLFTQNYMQYEADVHQELQMQRNRTLKNFITALICLVFLINAIIVILYRNNVQKKKANTKLAEQRDEISKQHQEIAKQHREITESIAAASIVQKAALPPQEFMDQILPEHFIFFRPHNSPHNTVSGDFYWMAKKGSYIIVAVADCTGHGVSGAIVSMLGISSLNKIVVEMEIPHSNIILDRLREMIINLLNPKGSVSSTRNGMDIAMVVFNPDTCEVEFSGAKNSLYWIHQGELIEKKANKMSVGADERQNSPFSAEHFVYEKGDLIYMTSDGYIDQFDSTDQEKFKSKRFKELLLSIAMKPLPEQLRIIEKTHLEWRGPTKQTDDVLVLGLKF